MDTFRIHHPNESTIKKFTQDLSTHTLHLTSNPKTPIWEIHNAYTNYCIILLMHITGHRPVKDPFCFLHEIGLDNQLILINDKVTHEKQDFRLVALPDLAQKQLKEYLNYLESLSFTLIRKNKISSALVLIIREMLQSKNSSIPLFFYLDKDLTKTTSVTPSDLENFIKPLTWMPLNIGRHIIASEIIKRTNNAEWAEIQLGHIESRDHPFGEVSELPPKDTLVAIGNTINSSMIQLGWSNIDSPLPRKKLNSKSIHQIAHKAINKEIHETKLFGHALRKATRDKRTKKHSELVRDIITSDNEKNWGSLTSDEFNGIIEKIREKSEPSNLSTNKCLMLFYRWAIRNSKHETWNPLLKRYLLVEKESSPFKTNTLIEYIELCDARKKFTAYLTASQNNNKKPSLEIRLAEITVSAALYSYIAYEDRLKDVPGAAISRSYRYENTAFIDLICTKNNNEPLRNIFRWFPDNISLTLLSSLNDYTNSTKYDRNKLYHSINNIVKNIFLSTKQRNPYTILSHMCSTSLHIEIPGSISSVARGKIKSVSIPTKSYIRLISGKSLQNDTTQTPHKKTYSSAWAFNISDNSEVTRNTTPTLFLSKLKKAFNQSEKIMGSHNQLPSHVRKKALINEIKTLMNSGIVWPVTANIIAAWTIELCTLGTKNKTDLAFSTVKQYVYLVNKALLTLAYDKNILEFDENMYEEFYINAVLFSSRSDAKYEIDRCLEFHRFLEKHWAVDHPNWSIIYSSTNCSGKALLADANVISESEYLRIINSLNIAETLPDILKLQYTTLLILGYRFNLRFGEAYRIQWRDIQIDNKHQEININIHNTHEGEVKSKAGIRVVQCIHYQQLSQCELDTINKLLKIFEPAFNTYKYVGLMSETDNHEKLIDRIQCSLNINNILRHITGDPNIRFHNLRHSWANHSCINNKYTQPLYPNNDKSIPLKEASRLIGHVTEETLLSSYLHLIDGTLQEYSSKITPELNPRALAYCLNISYENARKRLSRLKNIPLNYHGLIKIDKSLTPPCVELIDPILTLPDLNLSKARPKLSLLAINELLITLRGKQNNLNNIAERFSLSEDSLLQFIETATNCERTSGFNNFNISQYSKQLLPTSIEYKNINIKGNKAEDTRTRELLTHFQILIDKLTESEFHELENNMDAWSRGFDFSTNNIIITTWKDLINFQHILSILNINRIQLSLIVPLDMQSQINMEDPILKNLNIVFKKMQYAKEKVHVWKFSRMILQPDTTNSQFITKKSLSRIFFYLFIYVNLH